MDRLQAELQLDLTDPRVMCNNIICVKSICLLSNNAKERLKVYTQRGALAQLGER